MLLLYISAVLSAAAAVARSQEVSNKATVERFMNDMKSGITIDKDKPPYYDSNHLSEGTCVRWMPWGADTSFFNRHILQAIDKVEIRYNSHVENIEDNLGTTPTVVKLTTSTTETKALTAGWKVGGKLSLTGGEGVKTGVEVASEYAESDTKTHMDTTTVERTVTCEPGNTCRLETWTFYATIQGYCLLTSYFQTGSTVKNICTAKDWLGCDQFQKYHDQTCLADAPSHKCEVRFPIKDGSGKPVSRIVRVDTKLEPARFSRRGRRASVFA
ncbi:hypothetical protein QQS21_007054 [Conoideocrella luteorostrata]|uniref:Uncharacterized protein n=1 Tax=Conoideocrella luteorostrata TaxID=1105319 RepID=A0AAJ0CLE8_9HYPO|nr:hypothetical protein QQS21_007054 [Conoideocrella luteorostrata]